MKVVWALVKKELLLLVRDPVALTLLVGMPLLFTAVEGQLLGENFGQKPDDSLRISLVIEDRGKGLGGEPWSTWVLNDLRETPGIRLEVIPSWKRPGGWSATTSGPPSSCSRRILATVSITVRSSTCPAASTRSTARAFTSTRTTPRTRIASTWA